MMWNSRKAWGLVLGGMILVAIINLWIAFRSMPEGFDENWRHADAGLDGGLPAPDAGPAPDATRR